MRRIIAIALAAAALVMILLLRRPAPEPPIPGPEPPRADPPAAAPPLRTEQASLPLRPAGASPVTDPRALLADLARAMEAGDDERVRALLARLRDLLLPPVPEDQNAATLYRSAFALVDLFQPPRALNKTYFDLVLGRATPTDQELAALREWREKNGEIREKVVGLLLAAADRPSCRFPQDPERGIGAEISLLRSQVAVNLLTVEASLAGLDRQPERAAECLRAALAMSRAIRSDPSTINQMIACALEQVAGDAARREGALDSPRLREFVDGLDPSSVRVAGQRALLGDVAGSVQLYLAGKAAPSSVKDESLRAWIQSPLAPHDLASYVRGASEFAGIYDRPLGEVQTEFGALLVAHGQGAPWYAELLKSEAGGLSGVMPAVASAEARMTLMRLGSQLEQHRLRTGAYPASLEALGVPVPRDPFSGQAPAYRLEGGRYILDVPGSLGGERRLTWSSR